MILKDKREEAASWGFGFEEGSKQNTMVTHGTLLQVPWLSRYLDIWAAISADNISLSVPTSETTGTTSIDFTQYSYSILHKIYHFLHLIFSTNIFKRDSFNKYVFLILGFTWKDGRGMLDKQYIFVLFYL